MTRRTRRTHRASSKAWSLLDLVLPLKIAMEALFGRPDKGIAGVIATAKDRGARDAAAELGNVLMKELTGINPTLRSDQGELGVLFEPDLLVENGLIYGGTRIAKFAVRKARINTFLRKAKSPVVF